ncbi:MAG TPA: hypothetical protein VIN05_13620 [Roseovarius sp.]
MSRRFDIIAAAALALTLTLTGQAMAQLRVASGPAGMIEICTGSGPVRMLADKDGAPLSPPHVCPDCVMVVLSDHFPPASVAPYLPRVSRLVVHQITSHATSLAGVRPSARSPPTEG